MDKINNWYHNAIEQEAGMKDNLLMGLLMALLSSSAPMDAEAKDLAYQKISQQTGVSVDEVKQEAEKLQPSVVKKLPYKQVSSPLDIEMLKKQLIQDEGYSRTVYPDPVKGNKAPTIGIGCNLAEPKRRAQLKSIGADYNLVLQGKQSLNDAQINWLFMHDLHDAIVTAKNFVSNYESLPHEVKQILVNMAFNMGETTLGTFKEFKKALIKEDWNKAAYEMRDSDWYGQVGDRSKRLVARMEQLAKQDPKK